MDNPFDSITYTKRERKLFDPDMYFATLKEVKKIEVDDKKNPGQKKPKIVFVYDIDGSELAAFFNVAMGENAGIIKFLTKSYGQATIDAVRQDRALLWQFILDKVGKPFKLMVSQSNGFNNVDTAIPVKELPKPIADDDIPF